MMPAKTYLSHHSMQNEGVYKLLKMFRSKMKVTAKQKIADIGCGPGDTTRKFLLPLIPSDGELVGFDKSESMINIAKVQCTDPRSSFKIMDITKSEIAKYYKSYFDTAFSLYCLHWIRDQRSAMKNIYSILKPGGEFLSISVVDTVVYPVHEILAETLKWSPYMPNYKEVMPAAYRDSADLVTEVRNLMEGVGFVVEECSYDLDYHVFPSKLIFGEWMDGVNPFLNNIPAHLIDEFKEENKEVAFYGDWCSFNERTKEVTIKYTKITVFARKL